MIALLWARPIFALILLALVGFYVRAAWGAAKYEPRYPPRNQK